MPELPEVEVVVKQLKPLFTGSLITNFDLTEKNLRRSNTGTPFSLVGEVISDIARVGKYICVELRECRQTLLVHLGMAGVISVGSRENKSVHDIFRAKFDNGLFMTFSDVRGFGQLFLLPTDQALLFLQKVAPDPFSESWTAATFFNKLRGKRLAIKKLLLDQGCISGVGNIYACEGLFLAKINPFVMANCLTEDRAAQLLQALRNVLQFSINKGGASFRDYQHIDGKQGHYQDFSRVYNRAGLPCMRRDCLGRIAWHEIGGRSTYYCPLCQRE